MCRLVQDSSACLIAGFDWLIGCNRLIDRLNDRSIYLLIDWLIDRIKGEMKHWQQKQIDWLSICKWSINYCLTVWQLSVWLLAWLLVWSFARLNVWFFDWLLIDWIIYFDLLWILLKIGKNICSGNLSLCDSINFWMEANESASCCS